MVRRLLRDEPGFVGRANKKRRCAGADASASSGFWGHLGVSRVVWGFAGFGVNGVFGVGLQAWQPRARSTASQLRSPSSSALSLFAGFKSLTRSGSSIGEAPK